MSRASRVWHGSALAGYFLLLATLLAGYTWIAPPRTIPVSVALAVTCLPLLCPLRGLLHGRPYTHAWTSFLALPYFALGVDTVAGAFAPAWLGGLVIAASVLLFTAATGYARRRGREIRRAAEHDSL